MSAPECDRRWELDALREGRLGGPDADAFERHARICEVCSAAQSRAAELNEWLAGASSHEPSALELRRMRVRMLRSAGLENEREAHPYRARAALAAGLAISLLFVGFVVERGRHAQAPTAAVAPSASTSTTANPPAQFAAAVHASEGAHWSHTMADTTEHVRLDEGALSIAVRHRSDTEQLVIDLPDGTLRDRGTTFEVEAHNGHTTRVTVVEGTVALTLSGADEILLHAGMSWSPPPPSPTASALTSVAPLAIAPKHLDDGATQYGAAVAMLRHRSYADAAVAFDAYLKAHPHEPDAEDASYLEAVALAQSGDATGALNAAETHLASYPKSFHRKEASLLIARLARDAGDCAKARNVLVPWLGDNADPEALATLRSCASP